MKQFEAKGAGFAYEELGSGPQTLIWGHGWGQNRQAVQALANSLEQMGSHTLIDFPGFGDSPPPPDEWGTEDYADAIAAHLKERACGKILWVGHSFGCRVGLQLAARHPELVSGLFLIAAAGLKRKRPFHQALYLKTRILAFKTLKALFGGEWASRKFGSDDYNRTAGVMRKVFVKVVNEDLSDVATQITCPVKLIYGDQDNETPPEIGERLASLIPDAEMLLLEGQDHYSVLANGRHQTAQALHRFIKELNP